MKIFKVQIVELDANEERTGNVLFALLVEAKNQIRAIDEAVQKFKAQLPGVYREYRHSYFIDAQEV